MPFTVATTSMPSTSLPDFADNGFEQRVLAWTADLVNFGRHGVRDDVAHWLSWMLVGGSRPKANKRSFCAGGVNAVYLAQDLLCAALEPYYHSFDLDNRAHFALLERATRPLPGMAR